MITPEITAFPSQNVASGITGGMVRNSGGEPNGQVVFLRAFLDFFTPVGVDLA
jgi:hypothetical protein